MTLKNDSLTDRFKGDCIRGCVLISDLLVCIDLLWVTLKNDAGTAKCNGDWIRGCVSISDLLVCIDLLFDVTNDAKKANCEGDRIRGCVSLSDFLYRLALNDFKNDAEIAKCEIGLEDVCQYQPYFYV